MSRTKTVESIISDSLLTAEETVCCLNCKYSFFSEFQEQGMCHNIFMVQGCLHPKMVSEFYVCEYWEMKTKNE